MNDDFAPFELAVKLKEKGFEEEVDEPRQLRFHDLFRYVESLNTVSTDLPLSVNVKKVVDIKFNRNNGNIELITRDLVMTRKEEIEKAAMQVEGVHPDWSKLDCFRIGFKEGAKYADKRMLDRACEYLKENIYLYSCDAFSKKTGYIETALTDEFETAFRQAMEGGAE